MPESPSIPGRPRYSIVVCAYLSHRTLARSLNSLRAQTFRDFEVVLVDSSPDDAGAEIARGYPEVRLIRPGRRLGVHAARNTGVASTRGERVVFTDPDCVAAPDWLMELDRAFTVGHRLVGGPVACGPGPWAGQALYLAKFWLWLPRSGERTCPDLPGASLAVERALFDAVGGVPDGHISGDTEFCLRVVRAAGRPAWFTDRAVTTHINEDHWGGAFPERFRRGRVFAWLRMRQPGWSAAHTAALFLGWPLLVARHALVKFALCLKHGHLRLFLVTWPAVVALDAAWMLGQAVACLAAPTPDDGRAAGVHPANGAAPTASASG